MIAKLKAIIVHFYTDSLYRNSIYLMVTTFTSAAIGMLFWVINTKLYSPEEIGIATALISSTGLISNFSMLGLNTGIIRYLPRASNKNSIVNSVITTIAIASFVISILYVIGLSIFAPKLLILKEYPLFLLLFIAFSVILSLDSIFSSIFVSNRSAKYIFYKSIVGNLFKVIAPFLLVSLAAFSIYISSSLAFIAAFFVSLYLLATHFKYRIAIKINLKDLKKMFKLSFANYIASFLASLPLLLLPILIVNVLGAKEAAIFYLDLMIINLLNTIQSSIGQSLFAEGSNNLENIKLHIFKSIRIIIVLLIPAIFVTFFFGEYILLIFGKEYSEEGIILLKVLSLSVIFTSINGLLGSILNIKAKVNIILLMCIIGPIILLSLIYVMLPYGLMSLGLAWLLGEAIISIIYIIVVYFKVIK